MKKLFIIASLLLCWHNLSAQQLDYPSYLERVLSNNLDYQIAQLDLSVAQSELKSARKFNDMSLSAEYGNNSDWDIAMGQSLSLELSKSISLGKRNARIDVAKNALLAAESTLEAFRMTLKAEATEAYLQALLNRDLMLIIKHSADQMIELYRSDSLRAARGEISELDALQSRLEATMALQEQRRAEAEYHNANIQLAQLMGIPTLQIDQLQGTLSKPTKLYSISSGTPTRSNSRSASEQCSRMRTDFDTTRTDSRYRHCFRSQLQYPSAQRGGSSTSICGIYGRYQHTTTHIQPEPRRGKSRPDESTASSDSGRPSTPTGTS